LIASIGEKCKEALPPDVRKGSAFPISIIDITFHRGEAQPRHGEKKKKALARKAGGFPHIRRQSRRIVSMSTEEPRYRTGACPNCPPDAHQRLLFATAEYQGTFFEGGKLAGYTEVNVLSLFRCEGCKAALLYKTNVEGGCSIEDIDCYGPGWEAEWAMSDEFRDLSTPVYSSTLFSSTFKRPDKENSILDPSTADLVRSCYEIGTRVRPISKDLYVVQLRKALEAVCKDRGVPEYLAAGKRANLYQQIEELAKHNKAGEVISKVAHELRDVCNRGAHYSDAEVTDGEIRRLEHLLALVTNHVYGG
jgi:hypothetical protein